MIGISHSAFIPTPTHSSPKSADENALNSFDVFFFAEIVARLPSSSSSRETPEKDFSPEYTFKALFVARNEDEKDKDKARGGPSSRRRRLFERAEDVLARPPPAVLVFDDGAFCARIRMEILKQHIATFLARTRDVLRDVYTKR